MPSFAVERLAMVQVMADVSAALPRESALRRERQARWDSDVSERSGTEDEVRVIYHVALDAFRAEYSYTTR